MTPDQIVCRCCQNTYEVIEGCAICETAKANIIWPALKEDNEAADLANLSRRTLRLLASNIKRLEHSMTTSVTREYYPAHGREAAALAKAMSAILTEARKLEEREEKRVKAATFDEQVDIWHDWFGSLPREHKVRVLGRFEEYLLPAQAAETVE